MVSRAGLGSGTGPGCVCWSLARGHGGSWSSVKWRGVVDLSNGFIFRSFMWVSFVTVTVSRNVSIHITSACLSVCTLSLKWFHSYNYHRTISFYPVYCLSLSSSWYCSKSLYLHRLTMLPRVTHRQQRMPNTSLTARRRAAYQVNHFRASQELCWDHT